LATLSTDSLETNRKSRTLLATWPNAASLNLFSFLRDLQY